MADEAKTDETEKDTETGTISLSVEEYNKLKAQVQGVQTFQMKIQDRDRELEKLRNDLNEVKSKKAPSREEIEQEIRTELNGKLTQTEQEKAQLANRLKSLTVTDKVMSILGDKLVPDARKFIRMEIEKECDLEGDFDSGQIVVKDENGNIRWSATKPDQKMSADEYAEMLKSRYPSFIASNARSAEPVNGAHKMQGQTTSTQRKYTMADFEKMTDAELNEVPQAEKLRVLSGR